MHGIHETRTNAGNAAESQPVGESGTRIAASVREQQDGLRFRRLVDQMSRRDRDAREGGEAMLRGATEGKADTVGNCDGPAEAGSFLPTACCAETDAHVGAGGIVADLLPQTAAPAAVVAPANPPASTTAGSALSEARAALAARMERIETALRLSAYADASATTAKMEIALDQEVLPGSLIRIVQEAGRVRVQLVVPEDVQRARAEAVLHGLGRHLASSGLERATVEIHTRASGRDAASMLTSADSGRGADEEVLLTPDCKDRLDAEA